MSVHRIHTIFRPLAALIVVGMAAFLFAGCSAKSARTYNPVKAPKRTIRPEYAHSSVPYGPKTEPYTVAGVTYRPYATAAGYDEVGVASWYGKDFHAKPTAGGEIYDMHAATAAHKLLPLGTIVEVTNLANGRTVRVKVNDRGPFVGDRIIDLSYAAAKAIGSDVAGLAKVRVRSLAGAPSRSAAGRTPRANAPDTGVYYVQVGTFSHEDNAVRAWRELKDKGYTGTRIVRTRSSGRSMLVVQAGAFGGKSVARKALSRLRRDYPTSFIAM